MGDDNMLNLNWNNFGDNFSGLVKEFRDDKDFHDVTLLCEDGQLIPANKFMLACCSTFFKFVFKKTLLSNVVVYLKGVKGHHMKSILDFIYHGSTNVHENQLTAFLETAHDLKIRGLVEPSKVHQVQKLDRIENDDDMDHVEIDENELISDVDVPNVDEEIAVSEYDMKGPPPVPKIETNSIEDRSKFSQLRTPPKKKLQSSFQFNSPESKRMKFVYGESFHQESSTIMTPPAVFGCKVCGKSFSYKHVLENHIETHMDNEYPCDVCNKIFKTRNSLKSHLSQKHRNPIAQVQNTQD